jgi:hypothetical protein
VQHCMRGIALRPDSLPASAASRQVRPIPKAHATPRLPAAQSFLARPDVQWGEDLHLLVSLRGTACLPDRTANGDSTCTCSCGALLPSHGMGLPLLCLLPGQASPILNLLGLGAGRRACCCCCCCLLLQLLGARLAQPGGAHHGAAPTPSTPAPLPASRRKGGTPLSASRAQVPSGTR